MTKVGEQLVSPPLLKSKAVAGRRYNSRGAGGGPSRRYLSRGGGDPTQCLGQLMPMQMYSLTRDNNVCATIWCGEGGEGAAGW